MIKSNGIDLLIREAKNVKSLIHLNLSENKYSEIFNEELI